MSLRALRILWVKTGPLHPLDKGGNIRTYNMLKVLKNKHRIIYLSLMPSDTTDEIKELSKEYADRAHWVNWQQNHKKGFEFCTSIIKNAFFSKLPYVIEKYKSQAMKEGIQLYDIQGECDLIVCDFLTPSVNFPQGLKTAKLLFQHNVESMIWKGYYKNQNNPFLKKYLFQQYKRMSEYERAAGKNFDGVITVSKNDTMVLERDFGYKNILGDVPTGVDTEYFKSQNLEKKPMSLVFSGSMDWIPNEDAVLYFAKEIYPIIKRTHPNTSFTVVGRNPSDKIKSLSREDKSITVTGTVKDVRPYINKCQVYVVPLRIGSGTRIKILEAMSLGMPVVSTGIGAEGLGVSGDENILIADGQKVFAETVIGILEDDSKRAELSKNARLLAEEKFSWEYVITEFERLIAQIVN